MPYTVKDLKQDIAELPDDMEIILQADAEGNGYRQARGVDPDCVFVAESPWYGEVYSTYYSADDNCMDEDYWEKLKQGPKCLVIHPIN